MVVQTGSNQFQNFTDSLYGYTNSACLYCKSDLDSAKHQLFSYVALDYPYRQELSQTAINPSKFIQVMVFSGNSSLYSLLYGRVEFIDLIANQFSE